MLELATINSLFEIILVGSIFIWLWVGGAYIKLLFDRSQRPIYSATPTER